MESRFSGNANEISELDQNKDIFWVWAYPSISADAKTSIQTKVAFESEEFVMIQTDEGCFYALSHRGSPDTRVLAVTVILHTNDFHPSKYKRLLDVLIEVVIPATPCELEIVAIPKKTRYISVDLIPPIRKEPLAESPETQQSA